MTSPSGAPSPLEPLVARLERAAALDVPGKALARRARGALGRQPLKDALSGTWIGHALHPVLTDVVIGSFLSCTLLDLLGGDRDGTARRRLVGVGIASALPTALSGAGDWADAEPGADAIRRTGLVHAASNSAAVTLYAGSLAVAGRHGVALRLAGAAALLAGGYLGGHLSFRQGVGPDQTIYDPGPDEWTAAGDLSVLGDRERARVVVGDTPILLLRAGGALLAVHDRCSHRGCSLSDGTLEGDEIVCVCHGSRFDRRTGAVRRGPATAPQPSFEVRVREQRIEVRRRIAG